MSSNASRLASLVRWLNHLLAVRHQRGARVAAVIAGTVALLAAILVAETARKRPRYHHAVELPGLSRLFGHALMLGNAYDTLHDVIFNIFRDQLDRGQGLTAHLTIPFAQPRYITVDPRNVEHVLKTKFDNYIKGPGFIDHQHALLGGGIFNTDGDAWRVQRKAASQIFSVRNFRDHMLHVFSRHARTLVDKLDDAAAKGTVVDLHDWFHRFTLDGMAEIAFGSPIDSLKAVAPLPFAVAFDRAQAITNKRMIMGVTQRQIARLRKYVQTTDEFAYRLIAKRRADPDAGTANDLLARFLAMKKPGSTQGYSDQELRDMIINFIIAGRDTTAQALSWTIFELAQHPRVIAAMRDEIARVLPTLAADENVIDYDALTRDLVYARAVLSEALRLHPSVPEELKFAVQSDVLPDGTPVRAGEGVQWSPYTMGRLTELWGGDALEFKPERWIGEDVQQPGPYKYPIFNAGPRTCLGQQMAYLEGVACLVKLVSKFDFEVVDPSEITYGMALTLPMRDGLKVRVQRYIPLAQTVA
ncbi:Protein kinase alk2 [Allomyces javanicus]|nr:Protein kinase alk2 [Allomyces javanicus]